jgi:hypothetical protein
MRQEIYKEGLGSWIRIHMGNLPAETKHIIRALLDTSGSPKYHQPKYFVSSQELAQLYNLDSYPEAWVEGDHADVATMFCPSQKKAFRVRKELRTRTGTDTYGRPQLVARIHFVYEEEREPKRWTG